ncbi:D-tyrosyl-tRNA(Tyr) deacylase [Helicostylum pulchrum]|uniref:D-aminoacyl-tRNA deacylase n=1 Tax=Helicostylum pulchrum TaxID=562976 RepID=A0ABP9YCE1_9FUNG
MRAVLQRVTKASVTVDDKVVGSIGKGVCVLLGIGSDDTDKDVDYMVNKILNIRVFDDNGVMWKKGVKDAGLELLCGKNK